MPMVWMLDIYTSMVGGSKMNKKILTEIAKLSNLEIDKIIDIGIWEYHQNIIHSTEEKNIWEKMNHIRRIIDDALP